MDDLTKINGVSPASVEKLKSRGIERFAQIAELTDDQILQLNDELDLRDSIINNDWRAQAKSLLGTPDGDTPETQPQPASDERMIPVRVNRDYWAGEPGKARRVRKGTIVEVPVQQALDGIESGALSQVK